MLVHHPINMQVMQPALRLESFAPPPAGNPFASFTFLGKVTLAASKHALTLAEALLAGLVAALHKCSAGGLSQAFLCFPESILQSSYYSLEGSA